MSAFDQLHPAVQHHVVNSLGWTALRGHQETAIAPIVAGQHVLVQAPTAGGKTEAALLPVLSRMLGEGWGAPSVIYLSPIKALLNDLLTRIQRFATLVGRRVDVWHGDVGASARKGIRKEPPDILLTTPESVEVMLVSRLLDHHTFFRSLRAVIVDEVHAFAGDDRGWHLLALLDRLDRLSGKPVQRIALSATLANPEELLRWFTAGATSGIRVITSTPAAQSDAEIQLDYVGNVQNAAIVISRMYRGQKRLVFADSRSQVESLAGALRQLGVQTHVSHSSLGIDERRSAEAAFARGTDCVIVATSTLELGLDVGDLDRVIQIDAPFSVASFLQRIGRSGRRPDAVRNCLFLATTPEALIRACGILRLWQEGYVEPVSPPARPYHVLAQQLLGLALQENGVTRVALPEWVSGFMRTAPVDQGALSALCKHMIESGILFEDGGLVSVGVQGEARYGKKNYLEVFSVFLSAPLFRVLHGRTEIGSVHESTFGGEQNGPTLLSLAGRGWSVNHIDWSRREAHVEHAEHLGKSRWIGTGQPMHFRLAQSVKASLLEAGKGLPLSDRGSKTLAAIIDEFAWLAQSATTLVMHEDEPSAWWTFAGRRYNAVAAQALKRHGWTAAADNLAIYIQPHGGEGDLPEIIGTIVRELDSNPHAELTPEASADFKFTECLPADLLAEMLHARLDPAAEAGPIGKMDLRVRRVPN